MSKYSYRLRPPVYRIGETESYYSDMAAKGYLLKRRILFLDQYEKREPRQMEFRIELTQQPGLLEEYQAPVGEQKELYEDSGWNYITGKGNLSVFAADSRDGVPEIHTSPELQAETIKVLRQTYINALIYTIFDFILLIVFGTKNPGSGLVRVTAESSGLLFLLTAAALLIFYRSLYASLAVGRVIRKLKRGIPIDHHADWRKGRRGHRTASVLLFCLVLLALFETVREEAGKRTVSLPLEGEGQPYLILSELEEVRRAQGEEIDDFIGYADKLEVKQTMAAPVQYYTYELAVSEQNTEYRCWMYQDYYETISASFAMDLAEDIMSHSVWMKDPDGYVQGESRSLDLVRYSGMELLVVKGKRVLYIMYSGNVPFQEMISVIEEKWAAAES